MDELRRAEQETKDKSAADAEAAAKDAQLREQAQAKAIQWCQEFAETMAGRAKPLPFGWLDIRSPRLLSTPPRAVWTPIGTSGYFVCSYYSGSSNSLLEALAVTTTGVPVAIKESWEGVRWRAVLGEAPYQTRYEAPDPGLLMRSDEFRIPNWVSGIVEATGDTANWWFKPSPPRTLPLDVDGQGRPCWSSGCGYAYHAGPTLDYLLGRAAARGG